MKTSSTTLAAIFLVLGQQQICAEQAITTLPVLSHHHILKRRNLHSTVPGVTKQNIPIVRKLSAGVNDEEDEVSTLEVGGLYQGYGTHYVDLWIGTPTPQRQTVIVDTGSGITAFPCQGCRDCGKEYHASDFFDESQSESYTKMTCDTCVDATCRNQGTNEEYCHVSVSYQEGSMWAAHEGRDRTYLGGLHDGPLKYKEEGTKLGGMIHGEDPLEATNFGFDMTFGCQTKITGLFKTQLADGIMGMCLKESSIFQQMYQQNVIQNPSFSLCFVRGEDAAKEGTTAGALTMGGTDSLLHASPMVFARGFKTKGVMHGVSIRQVHIMEAGQYRAMNATSSNTHTVKITQDSLNTGSVIVDSGTTDTYFTRNLSGPFKTAFKSVTGFSYNENGMTLTEEEVNKLPTILIQLEGVVGTDSIGGLAYKIDPQNPSDVLLAIPPAHYIEYDTGSKHYIGRFSMSESRGSVIGANTMRGHDVFFDIPSSGSIGFAESDCDYSRLSGSTVPEVVTEPSDSKGQSISTDDDDEYYETENSKLAKDVIQPSSTSESKHSCDDKCTRGAIGFGFVAGAIVIFAVYKKVVNRNRAMYEKAITETEHLNDLVLDTEIQLTEIS